MKKAFLFVLLFSISFGFASNVNQSVIESDLSFNDKEFVESTNEVKEESLGYCLTTTLHFYESTFVGMDGETYDIYRTVSITTCF